MQYVQVQTLSSGTRIWVPSFQGHSSLPRKFLRHGSGRRCLHMHHAWFQDCPGGHRKLDRHTHLHLWMSQRLPGEQLYLARQHFLELFRTYSSGHVQTGEICMHAEIINNNKCMLDFTVVYLCLFSLGVLKHLREDDKCHSTRRYCN